MNLWDWARQQQFYPLPADTVGIEISAVMQFFWQHEQNEWDVYDDFPNLAPPFRHFFMWGHMPKVVRIEGQSVNLDVPPGGELGNFFKATKTTEGWSITCLPCGGNATGRRWQPLINTWKVDSEGGFHALRDGCGVAIIGPHELLATPGVKESQALLYPPFLATCFLHCRNVRLVQQRIPEALRRACIKRGRPRHDYSVLDIQPMRTVLQHEGRLGEQTLKKALHICRGHFKDYRDGAGLFGKLKGLYWWDQSLRGSAENGSHDKTYRIRAPETGAP